MNILWVSDPPTSTSAYGQQTSLFIQALRRAGPDGNKVALLTLGGSAGSITYTDDDLKIYPTIGDPRGNDVVALHARDHKADLVITLGDPHVFDPNVYGNLPWLAWAPTDFIPPTKATLNSLRVARWVWSPSKCGVEAYREAGLSNVEYVPHGVDSDTFTLGDKTEARKKLEWVPDGAFLVVMVAANKGTPSRKGFYEALAAFKMFSDKCSEARLYLHTEIAGIAGGEDLREIAALVGLDWNKLIFPLQYKYMTGQLGLEYLATVYQAADVYLSTSHAEGFGIPLVEAQMCGCPVIAPDNTAQRETVKSGIKVRCTQYMPFDGGTLWYRPDVEAIVHALELRFSVRNNINPAGYREAVMEYDFKRVFTEHFLPALDRVC